MNTIVPIADVFRAEGHSTDLAIDEATCQVQIRAEAPNGDLTVIGYVDEFLCRSRPEVANVLINQVKFGARAEGGPQ